MTPTKTEARRMAEVERAFGESLEWKGEVHSHTGSRRWLAAIEGREAGANHVLARIARHGHEDRPYRKTDIHAVIGERIAVITYPPVATS